MIIARVDIKVAALGHRELNRVDEYSFVVVNDNRAPLAVWCFAIIRESCIRSPIGRDNLPE